MAHKERMVTTGGGYSVLNDGVTKEIISQAGEIVATSGGVKQFIVMKPDVAVDSVVAAEDVSSGTVATATIARTILDTPRNLLYTLTDAASATLTGIFTVVGTDQFGVAATEVTGTVTQATAVAGTQVFATITSIKIVCTNAAASDTADGGVAVAADVASFGLPEPISAVTDVKNINWIDDGTTKTQNIDATSVVIARDCIRPEQTVAAADDYVITYQVT